MNRKKIVKKLKILFIIIVIIAIPVAITFYKYNHCDFDIIPVIASQEKLIPDDYLAIEDTSFNDYFFNNENIPNVYGKVVNYGNTNPSDIKLKYVIVGPFKERITKFDSLKSDGSFRLDLTNTFPNQEIWLTIGDSFYTGIVANKSLNIELDLNQFKKREVNYYSSGVKYSDEDGELNTIINKHRKYKRTKQLAISFIIKELGSKDIPYDKYLSRYNFLFSQLLKIDNQFFKENPSNYNWIITNERLSQYFGRLRFFHRRNIDIDELITQFTDHRPYLVSNYSNDYYQHLLTYFDVIFETSTYKVDYGKLSSYSKLSKSQKNTLDSLNNYIMDNVKSKFDTTKAQSINKNANIDLTSVIDTATAKYYGKIARSYLNDTITIDIYVHQRNLIENQINKAKADLLLGYVTPRLFKDTKEKELVIETILKNTETDWCKTILKNMLIKNSGKTATLNTILKDSISPEINIGEPYAIKDYGATLYIADTLSATGLIKYLRNSYKDKAKLIDFWAIWCAPCLQEMPHSKKIQGQLATEPVEFIYLCTSNRSNVSQWEEIIDNQELGGTHFYLNDKAILELMALFDINGYPNYAFITKNDDYKHNAIIRMSMTNRDEIVELIGI